jgi:hypothetical protein
MGFDTVCMLAVSLDMLPMMMNQMSLLVEWIDETRPKGVQFSKASGKPHRHWLVWTALS